MGGSQVENALARPGRDHLHETQQVLVRVAESKPAADARLEQGGRPRYVERHHALVGIPDIYHAVDMFVRGLHLQDAEQLIPIRFERVKGQIRIGLIKIFCDNRFYPTLVDRLRFGWVEFLIPGILVITQQEDDLLLFAGLEGNLDTVRPNRLPAMSD